MASIEWTSAIETGDARIDEQHRALIQAFNDLVAAVEGKRGWEAADKTLRFLVGYTVRHFQMEEQLMEEAQYPGLPQHRKLHHDLVMKVSALMQAHAARSANLSPELMDFLEGWLVEHIQGEDVRLVAFLRTR